MAYIQSYLEIPKDPNEVPPGRLLNEIVDAGFYTSQISMVRKIDENKTLINLTAKDAFATVNLPKKDVDIILKKLEGNHSSADLLDATNAEKAGQQVKTVELTCTSGEVVQFKPWQNRR